MSKGVAIVTGAGSGIGRAVAIELLDEDWAVVLTGRRHPPLEETAAMARGGRALVLPTDVTQQAAVEKLFERTTAEFGNLDVLFNNAGSGSPGTNFGDVTLPQWRDVLSVNLDGMFLCANAAFRRMRDQTPQGGRIINNGSISAQVPRPESAPYTVSKHGVTGLTKVISLDGRAFNIACSQIDIGNADTAMTDKMADGILQANGQILAEPRMQVRDVARLVILMASLPLAANVQSVSIMATNMPFIGRG